jgi:hypothetical protein
MRPDVIEGLAGILEPNLIHEIGCPIRLERPGGYRKMLQQSILELQLRVCRGKIGRPGCPLFHPFFPECSIGASVIAGEKSLARLPGTAVVVATLRG